MHPTSCMSQCQAADKNTPVGVGPIELRNPGLLMDVTVHKGGHFQHPFPEHWNAFTYVMAGSGSVGGTAAEPQNALVLEKGDFVEATSDHEQVCCNGVECCRVPVWFFGPRP